MTWSEAFGLTEILFLLLFGVLYLAYLFRMKRLASALHQKPHLVWLKLLIRAGYFGLLVIALLGPSFGASKKEIKTTGKDILIAVDLSQSMNAADVQPTRLEKIKFELPKIFEKFNSDRIGLLIFSSEAFLQCPFTFDQSALQLYTQTLSTNLVPRAGTDLAAPLQSALKIFRENGGAASKTNARLLVLISDGEDFGENLNKPLRDLKAENIRVFTMGVGSAEGSGIPVASGFKRDRNGRKVITKLNPAALREIADQTSGEYFEINGRSSQVSKLITAINNVKAEVRKSSTVDVQANKYSYPLVVALVLMAFDFLIRFNTIRL